MPGKAAPIPCEQSRGLQKGMGTDQKIRKNHGAMATSLAVVRVGHGSEEGCLAGNRRIGIKVLRRVRRLNPSSPRPPGAKDQ
jgi:hypothetical protein